MPEPHEGPDGLESMAFQLLLHKITNLERAMQGIPPLLKKIVDHLEAQTQQPDVPMATYAQLYPELPQGADEAQPDTTPAQTDSTTMPRRRRVWQWFVREG
jgi:hypothetical protein